MPDHDAKKTPGGRTDRVLLAMVRIANTILRYTELDDILAAITRELAQVITFDRSSVALMSPDGASLTLSHIFKGDATAEKVGEGRKIPVNETSVIGWVAVHHQPILRKNIVTDGRFLEVVKEEQLQSDMIVPLIARDELIGTINVGSYTPAGLDEHDLDLLQSCGSIACGAIEHVMLLREAKDLNERHRALRRNARDIIMLIDVNTARIMEVNRTCCRTLGYSEEELMEKIYFELFAPEDQFQAKRDFVNIIGQKTTSFRDRRFVGYDGSTVYVDISADVMDFQNETFVQVLVHDISQRKMLEQQVILQNKNLQEANRKLTEVDKMKTEFLQNISHELRTPLSIIIAYSESLRDATLSTESRDEFLDVVAENSQHLLRLINDLLDLSKLEVSGAMLCVSLSHVHDVIRSLWPIVEAEAREKGIDITFRPGHQVPVSYFDNKRIQQVMTCLIQNAIKFTESGGWVEVLTANSDDELMIQVCDNGTGMAPDEAERAFDAFHQADGSSTRRWGGLGIGLAMAKHLVEMHQGRIWVETEKGKGSTFTFVLPVNVKADMPERAERSPDEIVDLVTTTRPTPR